MIVEAKTKQIQVSSRKGNNRKKSHAATRWLFSQIWISWMFVFYSKVLSSFQEFPVMKPVSDLDVCIKTDSIAKGSKSMPS